MWSKCFSDKCTQNGRKEERGRQGAGGRSNCGLLKELDENDLFLLVNIREKLFTEEL